MSKCAQCAVLNAEREYDRHPNEYTRMILDYCIRKRRGLKTPPLRTRYLCPEHSPNGEQGQAQYKPDRGPEPPSDQYLERATEIRVRKAHAVKYQQQQRRKEDEHG